MNADHIHTLQTDTVPTTPIENKVIQQLFPRHNQLQSKQTVPLTNIETKTPTEIKLGESSTGVTTSITNRIISFLLQIVTVGILLLLPLQTKQTHLIKITIFVIINLLIVKYI